MVHFGSMIGRRANESGWFLPNPVNSIAVRVSLDLRIESSTLKVHWTLSSSTKHLAEHV